ncbi:MAG TPA: hypothetical protein VNG12_04175 [Acidimicrobiales bacterium]|nr:hypothetical protein [Acidimicrobiales bacterium]
MASANTSSRRKACKSAGCPYLHLDAKYIFKVTAKLDKVKRLRFEV